MHKDNARQMQGLEIRPAVEKAVEECEVGTRGKRERKRADRISSVTSIRKYLTCIGNVLICFSELSASLRGLPKSFHGPALPKPDPSSPVSSRLSIRGQNLSRSDTRSPRPTPSRSTCTLSDRTRRPRFFSASPERPFSCCSPLAPDQSPRRDAIVGRLERMSVECSVVARRPIPQERKRGSAPVFHSAASR